MSLHASVCVWFFFPDFLDTKYILYLRNWFFFPYWFITQILLLIFVCVFFNFIFAQSLPVFFVLLLPLTRFSLIISNNLFVIYVLDLLFFVVKNSNNYGKIKKEAAQHTSRNDWNSYCIYFVFIFFFCLFFRFLSVGSALAFLFPHLQRTLSLFSIICFFFQFIFLSFACFFVCFSLLFSSFFFLCLCFFPGWSKRARTGSSLSH